MTKDKYSTQRVRKRRARWVEQLGGVCVVCGSLDDLEFDHIDPSTKEFKIASAKTWPEERVQRELLKCQLLCNKCHLVKTRKESGRTGEPGPHGSLYRYKKGCRCELCLENRRAYNRNYFKTYRK